MNINHLKNKVGATRLTMCYVVRYQTHNGDVPQGQKHIIMTEHTLKKEHGLIKKRKRIIQT